MRKPCSSSTTAYFFGLFVLWFCVFVVAGCGSTGITQVGDDADGSQDVQQTDGNGTTPTGDNQGPDAETITKAAIDAAEALAVSLRAASPSADLQSMIETGYTLPGCPSVSMDLAPVEVQITLDYGTGCSPTSSSGSEFAGVVQGTAYIAVDAFELSFDEFSADELFLDGMIAGNFTRTEEGTAEFAIDADLTLSDGAALTATGTAEVLRSTEIITIPEAMVQSTTAPGELLNIVFADLLIDPLTYGNFIPAAGTATVVLPAETAGEHAVTITVEFTEQTPIDGTVDYVVDI